MKIKIKEVEIDDEAKKFIFDKLIELFTANPRKIAESSKGVEVNFPLNNLVEVWATLDLNVEYSELDSNHQNKAISVYANLKEIMLTHEGEELKGLENWNIEDLIQSHDWLQYF
jgi:hypothetical protein